MGGDETLYLPSSLVIWKVSFSMFPLTMVLSAAALSLLAASIWIGSNNSFDDSFNVFWRWVAAVSPAGMRVRVKIAA